MTFLEWLLFWLLIAQRLGLIDAPQQLLTEEEWKVIKTKANDRHDFSSPCVICKEELGAQAHVRFTTDQVWEYICTLVYIMYI